VSSLLGNVSFFENLPELKEEIDSPGLKSYSYSYSSSSVNAPSVGMVSRTSRHYRDSYGREEQEEERAVNDMKVCTSWKKHADGTEESVRRLKDINEQDISNFDHEWSTKHVDFLPDCTFKTTTPAFGDSPLNDSDWGKTTISLE
jgi:hypothetical protein